MTRFYPARAPPAACLFIAPRIWYTSFGTDLFRPGGPGRKKTAEKKEGKRFEQRERTFPEICTGGNHFL
jgi:hypothetical protein